MALIVTVISQFNKLYGSIGVRIDLIDQPLVVLGQKRGAGLKKEYERCKKMYVIFHITPLCGFILLAEIVGRTALFALLDLSRSQDSQDAA